MKHTIAALSLMTSLAWCMEKSVSQELIKVNEKKIKGNMVSLFRKPWEKVKQNITKAIELGVSTVDVQEYDTWGDTPLSCALKRNDLEFIEYLLKKGANPNFEFTEYSRNERTPVIFIAETLEAAQLLVNAGANVHSTMANTFQGTMSLLHYAINGDMKDDRLFDYYQKQGLNPYEKTSFGDTLWHSLLCLANHCKPIERFMDRAKKLKALEIYPCQKNNDNQSAFTWLLYYVKQEQLFLKRVRDGNAVVDDLDRRKQNLAIQRKFLKVMMSCE